MKDADRFRARARHCRALASETTDSDIRDLLLRMAAEGEAAAQGIEARQAKRPRRKPSILRYLRHMMTKARRKRRS